MIFFLAISIFWNYDLEINSKINIIIVLFYITISYFYKNIDKITHLNVEFFSHLNRKWQNIKNSMEFPIKKTQKTSYINLCFIIFTNFIATSLAFNGVFTIEMTPLPLFLELRLFVTMIVFKFKNGNLVMLFV